MSKVEELLEKYNPDGVEDLTLGEICLNHDSKRRPISKGNRIPGNIPYYGANGIQDYVDDYLFNGEYILVGEDGSVITEEGTPIVKWVHGKFWVNNHAHIFSENLNKALLKYVFYILQINKIKDLVRGVPPKLTKESALSISLKIPHIKVQEEIVKILDSFTNLIDALNEELSLRQKQFEYYREKLLTFDDKSINVNTTPLGEIGNVCMCKRIMRNETNNEGGIPFYKIGTFGGIADSFISKDKFEEYKNKYNYPKLGDILISASGTIGKTVVFDGKPSYYQDSNIVWIDNDETKVINSFLRYIYTVIDWKVDDGGVIKRLYNTNIRSTLITYPKEKAIQQSIVEKLDAFESLISSLKEEIALRQKQYEYYREKLLTFD